MDRKPSKTFDIDGKNYSVLVFDLENKTNGKNETAKQAKGYFKFLKNPKLIYYLHFLQDLVHA